MQLPCLASSLQQWHYPPSLSILGAENLGAAEEKAVGHWQLPSCICQIPSCCPWGRNRGPPRTEAKDQCASSLRCAMSSMVPRRLA